MGTRQEQLAALISLVFVIVASAVTSRVFPVVLQARVGTPAWYGAIHLSGMTLLSIGVAILTTRIWALRRQSWQYRLASPLGGTFIVASGGLEAALVCLDLGLNTLFVAPMILAMLITALFLLWAHRYRVE